LLGPAIVGLAVVAQQTPLAVTGEKPSAVTFPPVVADVVVIAVTAAVVTVAAIGAVVVNVISLPYATPALLIAYART
jgi:hypothetical protein